MMSGSESWGCSSGLGAPKSRRFTVSSLEEATAGAVRAVAVVVVVAVAMQQLVVKIREAVGLVLRG